MSSIQPNDLFFQKNQQTLPMTDFLNLKTFDNAPWIIQKCTNTKRPKRSRCTSRTWPGNHQCMKESWTRSGSTWTRSCMPRTAAWTRAWALWGAGTCPAARSRGTEGKGGSSSSSAEVWVFSIFIIFFIIKKYVSSNLWFFDKVF